MQMALVNEGLVGLIYSRHRPSCLSQTALEKLGQGQSAKKGFNFLFLSAICVYLFVIFIDRRHHIPVGIEGVSLVHPPVDSGPQLLIG